jgi:hypothetical protein
MADQSKDKVKNALNKVLAGNVSQGELDAWKEKFKEVHIVTVTVSEHEKLTGYFKKPGRDIMANCVNLSQEGKVFEAREFLALNTFIGGDKTILSNEDAAIITQTKLWSSLNFLKAEVVKY